MYLPTYTPLKSTNLGRQLIVSLVDIFGTKINQIKQQCYFILPIICNDFLKRVKVTAENKQNIPTLYAKILQTSNKVRYMLEQSHTEVRGVFIMF